MTDEAKRLSDAVAAALLNIADDLSPGDLFGKRLFEAGRDAIHDGDCTKKPYSCLRCGHDQAALYAVKFMNAVGLISSASTERPTQMTEEEAREILAQIYARNNAGADLDRAAFVEVDEAIAAILASQPSGVSAEAAMDVCAEVRDGEPAETWPKEYAEGFRDGADNCVSMIFNKLIAPTALPIQQSAMKENENG